jgi:hypothetical protein
MMAESESTSTFARAMADLLRPPEEQTKSWTVEDLRSVLRHQLEAPLAIDLGSGSHPAQPEDSTGISPPLESFEDLLSHQAPPTTLLQRAKSFFKTRRHMLQHELPIDVYTLLYYAAIAAGLVRNQERLTKLTDDELRRGLEWAGSRKWIPTSLAELFADALRQARGERSTNTD